MISVETSRYVRSMPSSSLRELKRALLTFDEKKVRTRYLAHPETSDTLEKLVENEKGEKKRTATEGLMWLLRYVVCWWYGD
jgi:hypothetical protein